MIFKGLSGFPITPIKDGKADIKVLCDIREYIDKAGLDSIGVLGSTGSFAYLSTLERENVMACWSEVSTPWIAGVSASNCHEAIKNCILAKKHGAQGVIANAFAYVPLTSSELLCYFLEIAEHSPLPLCVYDNPVNTGQTLSHDILSTLAQHQNIQALKVFAQGDNTAQHATLSALDILPGYAVDGFACEAMIQGGSAWYSTLAGTMPELLVPIMQAIKAKDFTQARHLNAKNAPIYQLMREHSGYRLMHALANKRGWKCQPPPPISMPTLDELSF